MESVTQDILLAVTLLCQQVLKVLAIPLTPGQRIFVPYLVSSVVIAWIVYRRVTKVDGPTHRTFRSFVRYLFPKEVWQNPSAWLDLRYFFFHQLVRVSIYWTFLFGVVSVVFAWTTGGTGLMESADFSLRGPAPDILISVAYMFVLYAFVDFASYAMHYLQHKVPLLWEFHKVHHSVEVMHPLSNYREHPIDNFTYALGTGAVQGLVMGLVFNLLGQVPGLPQILGVPLLMVAFNVLGYNLRHSHIWLRWPGNWSMVFGSPAHHHIHHSYHPDHIDKNFAFMFPIWDVLFRTYKMPESNEKVTFGLAAEPEHEFTSCLDLYLYPFKSAAALLWNNSSFVAQRRKSGSQKTG